MFSAPRRSSPVLFNFAVLYSTRTRSYWMRKAMPPKQSTIAIAHGSGPSSKRHREGSLEATLESLNREISPPPLRKRRTSTGAQQISTRVVVRSDALVGLSSTDKRAADGEKKHSTNLPNFVDLTDLTEDESDSFDTAVSRAHLRSKRPKQGPIPIPSTKAPSKALPSPFQLTSITDLPASENVDTVGIKDILGNVMIKEAWIFNYLIDLDWVMSQFDPDIRDIVNVNIVHGSWKKEDSNRIRLEEQRQHYRNVKIHCAHMPEPFGTHHTKMIILFRHDELAQIIIHTANMIAFDWTNMTQAAWCSPLLPLVPVCDEPGKNTAGSRVGEAFKSAILAYFAKYDRSRTGGLVDGLKKHSFRDVKAVFIGSVPGRFQVDGRGGGDMWGWMALKRIMGNIPLCNDSQNRNEERHPGEIVVQISSIATLGLGNTWLSPVLYKALCASRNSQAPSVFSRQKQPKLSIIFPTAKEVRDSLNGYNSGMAIHIRIQSKSQQKQLNYLQPFLCRWDSSPVSNSDQSPLSPQTERLSGRSRAAPHIKTYIRFADEARTKIDWAMLTSANLSTQAWGSGFGNPSGKLMRPGEGEVRICSYEAGVVVYPELFRDSEEEHVQMVPVFKKDMPDLEMDNVEPRKLVGLRMPYNLPIRQYGANDLPWCATMNYDEVDWRGQTWIGD